MPKYSCLIRYKSLIRAFAIGVMYLFIGDVVFVSHAQSTPPVAYSPDYGNQYILLIDDSADMNGSKAAIIDSLPDFLFNGIREDGARNKDHKFIPGFNPARDSVTVLYFTTDLKGSDSACFKGRVRNSVSPANLFELQKISADDVKNKDVFASSLRQWINNGCRFNGNASPIATAQMLALPYLQKTLPPGSLHGRTFIIAVTNLLYNLKVSPAAELANNARFFNLIDMEEASADAYRISSLFYFDSAPNWQFFRGVHYLVSEVKPQALPETVLQYTSDTSLDPQAVSHERLRVGLKSEQTSDLQIILTQQNSVYKFEPLLIRSRFSNSDGRPWRIGDTAMPAEAVAFDLTNCKEPECIRRETMLGVSLFDTAVKDLAFSPGDDDPSPGEIKFKVGFQYLTGLYDHLYVETPELTVKVKPPQPLEIPGFLFLPRTTIGKDEVAAEWAQDEDGKTTQEEAKNRIIANRNWKWLLALLLFGLIVAGILFYLYQTGYHRRFQPRLEWKSASDVVVDFNRPAGSRLLVGTLEVVNEGEVPWFGQKLKNKEQPARNANCWLSYDFFQDSGFKTNGKNPIGFINATAEESGDDGLNDSIQEVVSHGKRVYIFLAADAIKDYVQAKSNVTSQGKEFVVPLSVDMAWRSRDLGDEKPPIFERLLSRLREDTEGFINEEVECRFTVKPEAQRKPRVIFKPSDESKLYFKQDRKIKLGTFQFLSKAEHDFAQPFRWGDYTVQSYRDNLSLSGEPIRVEPVQVEVPPFSTEEVPVYLYCDGQNVSNPDPQSHQYTFKLIGDFDASSDPGPHSAMLYRDPARSEIELTITYPDPRREIFWSKDGKPNQRLLLEDRAGGRGTPLESKKIFLDEQALYFDPSTPPLDLLGLKVGNSATSGRGHVAVDFSVRLVTDKNNESGIHVVEDQLLDALLEIYDDDEPDVTAHLIVEEGDDPEERVVRLDPGLISNIEGARTVSGQCHAEIKLAILLHQDDKKVPDEPRELTVIIPLVLEKLPGLNWLCIDYGTSAIAAALGTGREGGIMLIPLQEVPVADDLGLAVFDNLNPEGNSRYLLPSWVICDADLRKESKVVCKPGFPEYYKNISLTPGEPDFVGLPALMRHFEDDQSRDRIIYSLKSWLGKSSRSIRLPSKVKYRENGEIVNRETLPLEQVVESGFAALAEVYLLAVPHYRADQIVISHPNTFTPRHRELLLDIAYRAFGRRFEIPLRERIRLISESDAVAYYYCSKQMKENPRSGSERILVYDFGAGTLDLSLVKVEWKKEPSCYPTGWEVEGRMGVPVAGHYIDELLARLIDKLLREASTIGASSVDYKYKLVEKVFDKKLSSAHSNAIINLWGWIREAKHKWNGVTPLNIRVGAAGDSAGIVEAGFDVLKTQPQENQAGLWEDRETKNVYLSIPAPEVNNYARMVEFIEFVTGTVIDELFNTSGIAPDQVDTVVISGRGALWAGLREKVWDRFPNANRPDLLANSAMKDAVVRGAIARQEILMDLDSDSQERRWTPKFGVLINHDEDFVHENDWKKPIDLTRSPTFRVVQVNLANPDPKNDMKSLRKHFYIDLTDQRFRREGIWARAKELYVRKEEKNEKLAIYLEDMKGHRTAIFAQKKTGEAATSPPWPIGSTLLDPDD